MVPERCIGLGGKDLGKRYLTAKNLLQKNFVLDKGVKGGIMAGLMNGKRSIVLILSAVAILSGLTGLTGCQSTPDPIATLIIQSRVEEAEKAARMKQGVSLKPEDIRGGWTGITIWLKNENGSLTKVELKNGGKMFIGPLGEFYEELPSLEQLRKLYGRLSDGRQEGSANSANSENK